MQREHLQFYADMRLPASTTVENRKAIVSFKQNIALNSLQQLHPLLFSVVFVFVLKLKTSHEAGFIFMFMMCLLCFYSVYLLDDTTKQVKDLLEEFELQGCQNTRLGTPGKSQAYNKTPLSYTPFVSHS